MNKFITKTRKELLSHISQKEVELKEVADKLKKDFVGLDEVINKLINNIKIWYIFPELQLRPTIVCLWGLTGVGKTDMVRKMVSYMKVQDRFIEIEMTDGGHHGLTLQNKLEGSSISTNDQCILLLDEFQKFRTIKEDGLANTKNVPYSDVWTLLSDGKFGSDLSRKTEFLEQMLNNKYYRDYDSVREAHAKNSRGKDNGTDDDDDGVDDSSNGTPEPKVERTYYTPVYLARRIKRLFRLEEDVETLMKWTDQDIHNLYETCFNNTKIYEGDEYKKMLIIISGNLDEAYQMAFDVSEADADADYYSEKCKDITIINIKDALLKRFRPEQIARFGNSHILYPSLSRSNYNDIIVYKCKDITDLIKTQNGIEFRFDKSVYDVIYNNGVFPTQGVRPLLSTITNILSAAMPTLIYNCLLHNINVCDVFVKENIMYAYINNKKVSEIIPTVLDQIRNEVDEDTLHVGAVHELGHALVYCLLFNCPPIQICINTVSSFHDGFVVPHMQLQNKTQHLNAMKTVMAGQAAEHIVFGKDMVSDGAVLDIAVATKYVWAMYCKYGWEKYSASMTHEYKDYHNLIPKELYDEMDQIISDARDDAAKLIVQYQDIFKFLLNKLLSNETLTADDFIAAFQSYNIKLNKIDGGKRIYAGYKELTKRFMSNKISYLNILNVNSKSKSNSITKANKGTYANRK